jgi:hypothetical protein
MKNLNYKKVNEKRVYDKIPFFLNNLEILNPTGTKTVGFCP